MGVINFYKYLAYRLPSLAELALLQGGQLIKIGKQSTVPDFHYNLRVGPLFQAEQWLTLFNHDIYLLRMKDLMSAPRQSIEIYFFHAARTDLRQFNSDIQFAQVAISPDERHLFGVFNNNHILVFGLAQAASANATNRAEIPLLADYSLPFFDLAEIQISADSQLIYLLRKNSLEIMSVSDTAPWHSQAQLAPLIIFRGQLHADERCKPTAFLFSPAQNLLYVGADGAQSGARCGFLVFDTRLIDALNTSCCQPPPRLVGNYSGEMLLSKLFLSQDGHFLLAYNSTGNNNGNHTLYMFHLAPYDFSEAFARSEALQILAPVAKVTDLPLLQYAHLTSDQSYLFIRANFSSYVLDVRNLSSWLEPSTHELSPDSAVVARFSVDTVQAELSPLETYALVVEYSMLQEFSLKVYFVSQGVVGCADGCEICRVPQQHLCLECRPNSYFQDFSCYPCAYRCSTCFGPVRCASCKAGTMRYLNRTERDCLCEEGFYENPLLQSSACLRKLLLANPGHRTWLFFGRGGVATPSLPSLRASLRKEPAVAVPLLLSRPIFRDHFARARSAPPWSGQFGF